MKKDYYVLRNVKNFNELFNYLKNRNIVKSYDDEIMQIIIKRATFINDDCILWDYLSKELKINDVDVKMYFDFIDKDDETIYYNFYVKDYKNNTIYQLQLAKRNENSTTTYNSYIDTYTDNSRNNEWQKLENYFGYNNTSIKLEDTMIDFSHNIDCELKTC